MVCVTLSDHVTLNGAVPMSVAVVVAGAPGRVATAPPARAAGVPGVRGVTGGPGKGDVASGAEGRRTGGGDRRRRKRSPRNIDRRGLRRTEIRVADCDPVAVRRGDGDRPSGLTGAPEVRR